MALRQKYELRPKRILSYRLDATNFSYEVDKSKTKPTTKIMEIVINR